jgi:hypothetical protein
VREFTRDTKKFNIMFNENVSYGFRRNLSGLKLPGFLLDAFAIFRQRWPLESSNAFDAKVLAVVVIKRPFWRCL